MCLQPFNDPPSHMFHVGYKLEAVDKRNPGIACVATVKDTIGDYVLIHFDGWQSGFDQWAHISSELLHPVGYCEDQELVLSIPSDWSARPTGFTWKQYLKETNSKPVPNEAFEKFPKSAALQIGQRLEAVDKRCLQLIRVAQIVSHSPPGFLTIAYDGWADKYNVCIEANSLDLFPVGYCQATGHPLQPPPGHELEIDVNGALGDAHSNSSTSSVNTVQTGSCPTSGCKGYGHVKGPRYSTHQRISGCPYADINMKRDLIRPHERLNACAIISPIPDSTSPSHMPKLDQAVPISSHTSIVPDLTSGSSLSPDSSVKTDLFVVSNTSSLSPSQCVLNADSTRSSKYANINSSVSPSAAQLGINGVAADLPRTCLANSVYVFDSLPAFDLTSPIEKIKPDNINAHLLPLDLSVERQRNTATNRASSVKTAKPSKLKRIDPNSCCDAVLETTTSVASALVVDPVTSQSPPQLSGTHFNDLGGNATGMIDKASSNCSELPDAIAPVVVSGSKRSLSDNSKPVKQETKPRLSQIANVANDYARQQQMFGLAGLPVKRKRGRPRKYTTINMIHTSCSRSVPQPTAPQARNSMPTVPFSYSANIPGTLPSASGTAPAIPSSTVMPTLSIYTPLTVGAPLPGLYSTTGLLIPSSTVSVCGDQAHAIPSLSPATWNPDSTSTGGTMATNISSQHSGSTEPATVSRSPTAFDSASLSTMDNQPTSMPSLSAVQSSAYDFCPTNTLSNSGPCTDSVLSGSVSLSVCPPDPFTAPSFHRFADSSTLFSGWCTDPVATGSCAPINPAAFCVPPHMYLDPPRCTGLPTSVLDQLCPPRISLDSMDTRSDDLDLLGRLLPQTQAALRASKVAGLAGPHVWNVEMVGSFVSTLPGCRQFATKFTDNEIDGAALLCLEQHDLMQILGMKLGPAVKVAGAIQTLRRNLMATPVSELGPDHTGAVAAAASCFSTNRLNCSAASDLNSDNVDRSRSTSDKGRAAAHKVTSTGDSR
ncbi:hypothetical protein AHF37_03213 [Paragonimus kellicotti]|nr:hypothetical protein AHF37_03213 [Paragonimus kellicotti]